MARFNLDRKGRQDELVAIDASEAIEPLFDPEAGSPTNNPFPDDLSNYNSLNVTELKDLCRERDLLVSGSKQELIARLNESDSPEAPVDETAVEEEEVVPEESATIEEGEVSESGGKDGGDTEK